MAHIRLLATLTWPDTPEGLAEAEAVLADIRGRAGEMASVTHAATGRPDPSRALLLRSRMDEQGSDEPDFLDTFEHEEAE